MIRAIVFDLFDTLVEVRCEALPKAEAGLELPTDERFGALLADLGIAHRAAAEKLTQVHMAAFRALVHRVSHHEPVLQRLRRRARRAGMVPVWIIRRVREPERELRSYLGPPPCRVIRDLAELELLLDRRPAEAAAF